MPKIQDILWDLGCKVVFLKLDLNMNYFIIPIAEEAPDIYAFVMSWGKFTYK